MPDEPNDSFRRFARDLRRVREDREVTLSTVQEATQVHESHLESFESGTLYEESRMNDIYLKAFVRAYAEAVGLSPDLVIEHLETALEGGYEDQLLQSFLQRPSEDGGSDPAPTVDPDRPTSESSSSPQSPDASQEPPHGEGDASGGDTADGSKGEGQAESSEQHGEEPPTDCSGSPSEPEDRSRAGSPIQTQAEEELDVSHQSAPGARSSGDQSSDTPKSSVADSGASGASSSRSAPVMAVGLLVLLLVGAGIGFYLMGNGSGSASTAGNTGPSDAGAATSSAPPPDTAASDTTVEESSSERPAPAPLSLGDTLYATVVATADVRELRVQQDTKLRRPYWIEEGEAMVFPFADRITLQNQFDNFRLLLEGYPYPTSRTDEDGRVVIARDTAQQFVDTLRGNASPIPAQRDTSWGDAPEVDSDTLDADSRSTR
jgi:cytoskeletal protein RodZ